jgi:hypothetical protein
MKPQVKRFVAQYGPIADAIARLDIHQVIREQIADALTEALRGRPDFNADLFWHLAADPLCECAGVDDEPCPEGHWIRVAMHLRDAPEGRAKSWRSVKPNVRCSSCGIRQFVVR